MSPRDAAVHALYRARPRSRFARISMAALVLLGVLSWTSDDFHVGSLFSARASRNFQRFLVDITPYPLQGKPWDWGTAAAWARETLEGKGADAVWSTVAMSVAAIVLAAVLAGLLSPAAARNLATAEPFLPGARPPRALVTWAWRGLVGLTRLLLIFLRAIPEYVWAFLLISLMGVGAWPAVAALALHNTGILGKLFAEVAENTEPETPRALRGLGASRLQIAAAAVVPHNLGRFLLYFFYRWETCVREASVLGLLGFVSLGWYIQQARAGMRYDEMVLFILLGVGTLVLGDLVSTGARAIIRRSG